MAVAALAVAYFLNEIGAEFGMLSQAHYDMVYSCLAKRDVDSKRRAAETGLALEMVGAATEVEAGKVADSTTQILLGQSTLAAILEFFMAQVCLQLFLCVV